MAIVLLFESWPLYAKAAIRLRSVAKSKMFSPLFLLRELNVSLCTFLCCSGWIRLWRASTRTSKLVFSSRLNEKYIRCARPLSDTASCWQRCTSSQFGVIVRLSLRIVWLNNGNTRGRCQFVFGIGIFKLLYAFGKSC